ncbi:MULTISPECIES: hypothetical protein [Sphingobacterium]|uniref:Lipoprotein n=1 Tax=Sphingobacterium litopenaei TaxID=2763500 RepID=A0ABR7YEK6_9SPHI|nr:MULTISPECIES: hypothetical protein [Sphingobacterium]MBD1429706.1 hypothetical protein [Sphingobacterium litopenaei]NGM74446.1 hypothetical protein [Sphingobacterium sp. SGL-16]
MKQRNLSRNINVLCILLFGSMWAPSCSPRQEENKLSSSYEKKLINYKEGTLLFDEYSNTNNKVLTEFRKGEPDSRWYWISLEDLEGYIHYVKENAKKQQLENLGLRIYLGKYPLDYPKDKMANPDYAGYQTIFIVPTTQTTTSQNQNIKSLTSTSTSRNEDITTISGINAVNLAPPPKVPSEGMQ